MAKDIQRKYRNTQLRGVSVAVGEITPEDVADGITDFVMTTIPAGSVISKVTALVEGVNTAQDFTVAVAGNTSGATLAIGAVHPAVDEVNLLTLKDEAVTVASVDAFTSGRVIIMVQFVRLDAITGDRVRAKEA